MRIVGDFTDGSCQHTLHTEQSVCEFNAFEEFVSVFSQNIVQSH